MRKYIFIVLAALAIFSCSKEENFVPKNETTSLDFVFKVSDKPSFDADTKGPKTNWTDGDKIYITLDDAIPEKLEDFLILKYVSSEDDWVVENEGKATPNTAGGTLDALYYENPSPETVYEDEYEGEETIIFENDESKFGQYFYLNQNDVPYTVEDGKVAASISLDFEENNVRTYVQFRITGIEGEWQIGVNGGLITWAPTWSNLHKEFQYRSGNSSVITLNSYSDGQYAYFSVYQDSDDITITLYTTGDNAGVYEKTFSKIISGKSAAITFKGPQFDEDGVPTNGWTSAVNFNTYDDLYEGHPYVEMGEGIFWATGNVGAEAPSASGDYFAWAEVEPYYSSLSPLTWKAGKEEGYYFSSYKYYEMSTTIVDGEEVQVLKVTKYNTDEETEVLEAEDDAASYNWGGKWRTPTSEEWQWLNENCTWSYIAPLKALKATSKVEGYEGKYILFQATGNYFKTGLIAPDSYYYYTATKVSSNNQMASGASLSVAGCSTSMKIPRFYGLQVRPVFTTE